MMENGEYRVKSIRSESGIRFEIYYGERRLQTIEELTRLSVEDGEKYSSLEIRGLKD